MSATSDLFRARVENPGADGVLAGLRRVLTDAKREAVEQATGLEPSALGLVMPSVFQQVVSATIDLCAHAGLAGGLALDAFDERVHGVCLAALSRDVRQSMARVGETLSARYSSRIAERLGVVEARRLVWRDIARDLDPVPQALHEARETISGMLGAALAEALEEHDRFMMSGQPDTADGLREFGIRLERALAARTG